jgi:imidazoleglycerol phosphate synthase glutamine amidotransferase subunit HisH
MQLMSTRGLEKTVTNGFGWIPGDVVEMTPSDPAEDPADRLEHAGSVRPHPLFDGIRTGEDGLHAYFVHSYHLAPSNEEDVVAAHRLRRAGHRGCRARQHVRHAVPPGKEPDTGSGPDRQFPQMEP